MCNGCARAGQECETLRNGFDTVWYRFNNGCGADAKQFATDVKRVETGVGRFVTDVKRLCNG